MGRGKVGEGIMGMEKCVKRKGGKEKIWENKIKKLKNKKINQNSKEFLNKTYHENWKKNDR